MNNFKKVLSLGLVLVMVVATMMIVPLTTSAAEGIEGDGTKENPFKVSQVGHITILRTTANSGEWNHKEIYVELTKDVSASGA